MQFELNLWTLHSWLEKNSIPHFYSLEDDKDTFLGIRLEDNNIDPVHYAILTEENSNSMYRSVLTFHKNRIYFQEHDLAHAINILNQFQKDYKQWILSLRKCLFEHGSLNVVLEKASAFFPYPTLVFCDSKIIAFSPDADRFADQLSDVAKKSSIRDLIRSRLRFHATQEFPVITTSELLELSRILINRCRVGQHYIWVISFDPERNMNHGDLASSNVLAKAIRTYLASDAAAELKRYTVLDDYFFSCSEGKLPSTDLSRRIFGRLHWHPDGIFCIWRIELTDASADPVMNIICDKIHSCFPFAHVMLWPNGLVLIFQAEDISHFPSEDDFKALFPKKDFYIGKSNPGEGYELLPDLIRQAFHAAENARKTGRFYMDAANIVSDFIYQKLHENSSIQSLIHPAIRHLAADDQKQVHPFSCILTLKTFLLCGGNYNETATRLRIHRNTLVNRIRHICETTGISLEPEQRESLLLSILLLDTSFRSDQLCL